MPLFMNSFKKDTDNNIWIKQIFIGLFIIILFLPIFQQVTNFFEYQSLEEKRKKEPFPEINSDSIISKDFYISLENYYNDHFGFRDYLIQTYNTWNLKLFNKLTSEELVMGKEGWLFYFMTKKDYQKTGLHSKEIDFIVEKLEKFSTDLEKKGIDFMFIISPNKNTIYPEYMSDSISKPKEGDLSNLDILGEKLSQNEIVNYYEMRPFLFDQKKNYKVYPSKDSHWTYV